jgi:hypothetical protein
MMLHVSVCLLFTGEINGHRVHVSSDRNLDICDVCNHTDANLHILHKGNDYEKSQFSQERKCILALTMTTAK